jgi:hypothetical protein
MKKLRSLQGGYPRQQDYLLTIQNELITLGDSLFASLGVDMVLSGCAVTDNGNGTVNIAAGIAYVSGEVIRFDGSSNVLADGTKTFIKDTAATTDPKLFADGGTKDVYTEIKAIVGTKSSITQIAIKTTLYTLKTYISDVVSSYAIKGEIKDIYDFDDNLLDNFDENGLGITARYSGWALFNGQNGGPDGRGRTRITVGTIVNDGIEYVYANGDSGGFVKHKLLMSEMPKHKFQFTWKKGQADQNESGVYGDLFDDSATHNRTKDTNELGGDSPHNNMQPYVAVYTIIKIV